MMPVSDMPELKKRWHRLWINVSNRTGQVLWREWYGRCDEARVEAIMDVDMLGMTFEQDSGVLHCSVTPLDGGCECNATCLAPEGLLMGAEEAARRYGAA
jgi:hypothetical protein